MTIWTIMQDGKTLGATPSEYWCWMDQRIDGIWFARKQDALAMTYILNGRLGVVEIIECEVDQGKQA